MVDTRIKEPGILCFKLRRNLGKIQPERFLRDSENVVRYLLFASLGALLATFQPTGS